jgi:hypothetical protein
VFGKVIIFDDLLHNKAGLSLKSDYVSKFISSTDIAGDGLNISEEAAIKEKKSIIIPMYIYPNSGIDTISYQQIINARKNYPDVPIYVILNPNSGPGSDIDLNYSEVAKYFKKIGIILIGYIYSNYGNRSLADMEADIDKWSIFYQPDGIFIDEFPSTYNPSKDLLYAELYSYIKNKNLNYIIVNPGVAIDKQWFFGSKKWDALTIWDNSLLPNSVDQLYGNDTLFYKRQDNKYACLAYNINFLNINSNIFLQECDLIYITSGRTSNPWSTLSPYLDKLISILATQ